MLTTFWTSIGGKLSDRLAAVSAPALIFWLGGLLAWSYANGGGHALTRPASWLSRQSSFTEVLVIGVVLVGVAASAVIVNRLTEPVLRLLEGYWPGWADPVRRRLVARMIRRSATQDDEWQQVIGELYAAAEVPEQPQGPEEAPAPEEGSASEEAPGPEEIAARQQAVIRAAVARAELLARYGRLERARARRPSQLDRCLPTTTGNILRAAETRPLDKYGLDAVAVWPRLWLALPEATRQEITAARTALDGAVGAAIWGILFLVFIPWTLLALPAGLAVCAAAALVWVPARAETFGQLVVAAFDIHRTLLYQQLRWPLPICPQDEQLQGRRLGAYLLKGSDRSEPVFRPPP